MILAIPGRDRPKARSIMQGRIVSYLRLDFEFEFAMVGRPGEFQGNGARVLGLTSGAQNSSPA